ncbi:dnaJ homolog subfamily C member 28 [Plutella xylostella]|uniref:dnaJ homolog subfamily C member 28 n=1 Tax=Plutella xylostella TaxID=51655 RepID=UPI0020324F44|nr:dnaJ homolog subfamily C member 28 [Plutella xylostella]
MNVNLHIYRKSLLNIRNLFHRQITSDRPDKKIQECYNILNLPQGSKHADVKKAFVDLAKKYHPDSGSPEADIEKFVAVENAFRTLSKHITGSSTTEVVPKIFDIKHTAPQHRQYLSFEGVGHGTPSQRQRQWEKARAQQAADNVMEHRVAKSMASENTLMKKEKNYFAKKHDIKTKYGFDRLVEDLIQESISKGEFENLSGKGKPLKDQNRNPYVDFTTHKINEVLINNGFVPEWITMNKEIAQEIEALKQELQKDRMFLGPYPLSEEEAPKWAKLSQGYEGIAESINKKINHYNLIVPLLNKQRLHIQFEEICDDVLQNGIHSVYQKEDETHKELQYESVPNYHDDLLGALFKAFSEVFSLEKEKKKEAGR